MKRKPVNDRCCMNPDCPLHGQFGKGNIIRHSFYKTSQGRRRRYLCKVCKKTFGSTAGTPYYRLQKSRSTFDEVATMAVEGVGISATARIKGLAPDTVANWREKAAKHADRFNDKMLKGFDLIELQADEMRTFVDTKLKPIWVLTLLEVWSRLWVSCVVGRRSYRNVKTVFGAAIQRGEFKGRFLMTSDGFEPYAWAVASMLSLVCVYAQVIKTRRKDRVIKVERRLISGTKEQIEEALLNSEDSWTINTSFIEWQNLTIRRGNSYLQRKTASHARETGHLDGSLALQMCHYNFIRPHMALKFGKETRTPAMQAGIVSKKLSFRDVFTSREVLFLCLLFLVLIQREKLIRCSQSVILDNT